MPQHPTKTVLPPRSKTVRIAIIGAGFSGTILARQLLRYDSDIEITVFEKMQHGEVKQHWTQPVTGAGLNINANAMATLKQIDTELFEKIRLIGLPRKSVTAVTVTGKQLYQINIVKAGLADSYGCRVRWDDANMLVRNYIDDIIVYGAKANRYTIEEDETVTVHLTHDNGLTSTQAGFDLLVAGDGRYSAIRSTITGTPKTSFGNVCNFRILLPNCNLDGSPFAYKQGQDAGLFDDLQLIYNATPSINNLAADSTLRHDKVFVESVLRSNVRVGIMRIPKSNFRNDIEESLYLFGNFAIPDGQNIPDSAKSAEALYCLFTPAEGKEKMTDEAKYIRAALSCNADKLHWARFQDIPVVYHDKAKKVLLLGDAAHSFCPSLGQGATLAIEDACIASHLLLSSIRKNESLSSAIDKISKYQKDRVSMIRDMSNEAAKHILFEADESNGISALVQDSDAWTNDTSTSQWRDKVRQMWLSYPKIPNQEHNTWLQQILKENSVNQYRPEFNKFLSSHSVSTIIAIEQLGGNRQHVQQFLARYTTKLEPHILTNEQQYTDASAFDLAALLGQRQHYYRVLERYQEKLEHLEGDVYALLQTSFPLLSAGIAGSLFHAGINLGYAVYSRSPTTIVEQLAYLHYTNNPLIYTKQRVENQIQFFGQGEHALLEVLNLLREDKNKFIKYQKTRELKMRTKASGWFSSTPQYRIAAMLAQGDMLIDYAHKIRIPDLFKSEMGTVDTIALSKWMLDQTIATYSLCEQKNEFVLLHCITASWAVSQIVPLLNQHDALNAIRYMLSVFLATFTVQECPVLHAFVSKKSALIMDDWKLICRQALAHKGDEHIYKVVAICKNRWFELRDKMSPEAQMCEVAAKTALNHEIYGHKYKFSKDFTPDLLGVSGIRDNIF